MECSGAATLRLMPARGFTHGKDVADAPVSPLQLGDIVAGKYRIERQIGCGGMGIVLAATHLQLEHLVAIKVMRRDLLEDDKVLSRLLSEARAAAKIRSEHVARVLDVGTLDSGAPFIVMEYLEGEDLGDLLDRQGALEVEQAVSFVLQACEALAEVHVAEMVHRDLKPSNLFIARLPDGSPTLKILDFGISKQIGGPARERTETTAPQILGSPFYMAPEQMRADAVDERSDIWALGTILFEMLAGRPPFIGDTLPEVYAAVLSSTPLPIDALRPGIPIGLDDIVQRCLDKDPVQRFCDVADLAEALAPFGSPASAQTVERITRILTNTDPGRGRYSAVPPAPTDTAPSEEHAPLQPRSVPPSPLEPSGRRTSPPAAELMPRPSSSLARVETADPPRPSRHTAMDLGALSATGASSAADEGRRRPGKALFVGVVVLMLLAAFAATRWSHEADSIGGEPAPPSAAAIAVANTPASVEPASPPAPPVASAPKIAPVSSTEPEPAAPSATPVLEPSPKIDTVRHALRPSVLPRQPTAVRPRAAAKLESGGASRPAPAEPPAAEPPPAEPPPTEPQAEPASPATPPDEVPAPPNGAAPAPRNEANHVEDPWNPSSFGERQ
jgi:serine/threonine protein kinase